MHDNSQKMRDGVAQGGCLEGGVVNQLLCVVFPGGRAGFGFHVTVHMSPLRRACLREHVDGFCG